MARKKKRVVWLKECIVCKNKETFMNTTENKIRASVLGCGHQGLFTVSKFVEA